MARTVDFYRSDSGKCPVEEFLDSLQPKEAQKVGGATENGSTPDQKGGAIPPGSFCQEREAVMSDLDRYIHKRKKKDPEFARGFEDGYREFKVGVLLKQAREQAGLTQEELAVKVGTRKTAFPVSGEERYVGFRGHPAARLGAGQRIVKAKILSDSCLNF